MYKPKHKTMKTVKLEVELVFNDDVVFGWELQEISHNVLDGIVRQANEIGITPADVDNNLKMVIVRESRSNTELKHKI